MALYAAHLTRTLQGTPSIFQVTAQETLGATVKPAIRKIFEYLGDVNPNRWGWALRWFDELFLVLDCCLQHHYLKHYAASFSESFYGLIRVPLSAGSEFGGHQRLPARLERGSLAALVLLPYLLGKVENLVERWRQQHEDGTLGKDAGGRARKAAVRVYAVAHLAACLAVLGRRARYVCGAEGAPSWRLGALGLTLRVAPPPDAAAPFSWRDLPRALLTADFSEMALCVPALGALVLRGVEYGAFGVALLRAWPRPAPAALPPPPPPQKEERDLKWKNKCPICLKTWRIPTVLPVSGYIFCYVCISREVRARGKCPASGWPAHEAQLLRLYVD